MTDKNGIPDLASAEKAWQTKRLRMDTTQSDNSSVSGTPIKPLYTPLDRPDAEYLRDDGFPGMYLYTRGIPASMYRGRQWTIRKFSEFGTAEDTNQRFKYLLDQGQTGLSVAFDVPTLMGYDSDHILSAGEVGVCGVAVDTLEDMAEKQGISWDSLRGTIQNDILKEYIAQKEWICPPGPAMKMVSDTVGFCKKHVSQWNPISISGYHIREGGSTTLQEQAFTLADGFAYIDSCLESGLAIDDFASRLSFFFVAKYRAARRIWARHLKERYGAKQERSWLLRFHTQTAGCSLTAQQPENNIVRTTIEALAGVPGGTQSLHTNALDEAYALPSEHAAKFAVRTRQIIAHETGISNTIDPLTGSYYVESLTDRLESGAEAYFERIGEYGGMIGAIEAGFPQREIMTSASNYQKALENGQQIVVGVKEYIDSNDSDIETLYIDPSIEGQQIKGLQSNDSRRDSREITRTLNKVKKTLPTGKNIMPPLLEAVKAYATLVEIVAVIQDVHGLYDEPSVF